MVYEMRYWIGTAKQAPLSTHCRVGVFGVFSFGHLSAFANDEPRPTLVPDAWATGPRRAALGRNPSVDASALYHPSALPQAGSGAPASPVTLRGMIGKSAGVCYGSNPILWDAGRRPAFQGTWNI